MLHCGIAYARVLMAAEAAVNYGGNSAPGPLPADYFLLVDGRHPRGKKHSSKLTRGGRRASQKPPRSTHLLHAFMPRSTRVALPEDARLAGREFKTYYRTSNPPEPAKIKVEAPPGLQTQPPGKKRPVIWFANRPEATQRKTARTGKIPTPPYSCEGGWFFLR